MFFSMRGVALSFLPAQKLSGSGSARLVFFRFLQVLQMHTGRRGVPWPVRLIWLI